MTDTANTPWQHPSACFDGIAGDVRSLGRGVVAMMVEGGVFVSWRLMRWEDDTYGTALENAVFTVLRDGEEIARVADTTCLLDPEGSHASRYRVIGPDGVQSDEALPFSSGSNWFDVPLRRPEPSPYGPYTIDDVSVGDLDGDGEYELVVLWDSAGKDSSEGGPTGNVLIDAYRLSGERLWKRPVNLGCNIRAGVHYTQFLVYDFDGDGCAEMVCKTAPGSSDGVGRFVSDASCTAAIQACDNDVDLRDESGRILRGDEFLTVFDGRDGHAVDTIYYPNQRVSPEVWGDAYGNRADRFTATVAHLDGKTPCAFFMRGYYTAVSRKFKQRQTACAVAFDGSRLHCLHSFDTLPVSLFRGKSKSDSYTRRGDYKGVPGYSLGNRVFAGQGNHNCASADIDRDGRDEVLTGALCYNLDKRGKLGVKWCTHLGHGDALHLGWYYGDWPLLLTVHEEAGTDPFTGTIRDCGLSLLDAESGRTVFHAGADGDTGRGMLADVGAGGCCQFWGAAGAGHDPLGTTAPRALLANGSIEPIELPGASTNFRIFWDGDRYDELLDGDADGGLTITSWDGRRMSPIFSTSGCTAIHGTKAVPCLQADILGDWREEILVARSDNEAVRVYTTDILTELKVMTLMQDHAYRIGVATEQSGYNQPPHIGFELAR